MKKRLIILGILICIFLFFSIVVLSNDIKYDFRKTNWGMSKEQIKATEDKKPSWDADIFMFYKVKINMKDFACMYYFFEDELYKGGYFFSGEHTNENLYIDDYEELKEILTKEYGEPKAEDIVWKNNLWRDDGYYRSTISIGDLSCGSIWETPTTEIELILLGFNNYETILMIRYESKERGEVRTDEDEGTGKWICSREIDPIDDTEIITFILYSDSGKSVFGKSIALVLRYKSGIAELYMNWHDYLGSSTTSVTYRFGTGEAVTDRYWLISNDYEATFRTQNTIRFIQKLMTIDRFVAQVTPYSENPVTAVFDVRGLKKAIEPYNYTLHWIKD